MNWEPSPSFVLGWLLSLTYPLASPQTHQGELVGNIDGVLNPREQILWLGESALLKEAESSLIIGSEVLTVARPSESQTELSFPLPYFFGIYI